MTAGPDAQSGAGLGWQTIAVPIACLLLLAGALLATRRSPHLPETGKRQRLAVLHDPDLQLPLEAAAERFQRRQAARIELHARRPDYTWRQLREAGVWDLLITHDGDFMAEAANRGVVENQRSLSGRNDGAEPAIIAAMLTASGNRETGLEFLRFLSGPSGRDVFNHAR